MTPDSDNLQLKFDSSMTLFSHASNEKVFADTLVKCFNDELDRNTLEQLR
jgi:uncharacterized protein (DUF1810 family)